MLHRSGALSWLKESIAMSQFLLVTLHLFAAIMFAGTVFFEILILESVRKPVGRDVMRTVETAIGKRARRLMPFVILALYGAGIGMAWQYRDVLAHPFDSSFATLLSIKIVLALSVLVHFITAVTLGARGKLKSRHVKFIHVSVFCHVVLIVFLAKAMFYVFW
ncbi:CopD family copper resistance protein [Mesorhizobium sp. A556]